MRFKKLFNESLVTTHKLPETASHHPYNKTVTNKGYEYQHSQKHISKNGNQINHTYKHKNGDHINLSTNLKRNDNFKHSWKHYNPTAKKGSMPDTNSQKTHTDEEKHEALKKRLK